METMRITRTAAFPSMALCRRFCRHLQGHMARTLSARNAPFAPPPPARGRVREGVSAPANPHADYPMEQSDD